MDYKPKIPPTTRETRKKQVVHCCTDSKTLSFDEIMELVKHNQSRLRQIIEKVLNYELDETRENGSDDEPPFKLDLDAKGFVKVYCRIRNHEFKEKIHKLFNIYINKKCKSHCGQDEDFYFLLNSVAIENSNPFYVNCKLNIFLDTILLNWQRDPLSYKTLNYLFEVLFYGRAINRYKKMEELEKQYGNFKIFTTSNINEIFKDACFGTDFSGKTPEVKELKRRGFLLDVFERLMNCIDKSSLQIGDSDCCDQFVTDALEQISLVKKYADMLYIINAIDKDSRSKKYALLDEKKQAILANQKKWKKKVTW